MERVGLEEHGLLRRPWEPRDPDVVHRAGGDARAGALLAGDVGGGA